MPSLPLIILASASPRRRAFMKMLGLPFTVHTADIDETPLPDEMPTTLVCRLSREKAQAVAQTQQTALIIAADTIVILDDQILGKPNNEADAERMLQAMRNRYHEVYSAVSLFYGPDARSLTYLSQTTVRMRNYSQAEIAAYIATGDPMDKAGAYAIQHPDFAPVAGLSGCYAGVMGLPLNLLARGLAEFGIPIENLGHRCASYTGQACCVIN